MDNSSQHHRLIEWANARLNPPVEIRPKFDGRGANGFVIFAAVLVAFFVLGPPIFLIVEQIYRGVPPEGLAFMLRRIGCLGIWIVVGLAAMSAVFVLPMIAVRRHLVKWMGPDGVTTRHGHQYPWHDLKYLEYKKVRWVNRGVSGATQQAMFSGSKRISIDMVFGNGKAVIPPLIKDQDHVLALIETMPVEHKGMSG